MPDVTAPNPSTAQAQVMMDELVRQGVRHIVIAPGSRSAALVLAASSHPDLRSHVAIDERSAGFLALGISRVTGAPAPVITTSGTAVANLHPAVVEADADGVPFIALTADRPPELRGTGANQTIDQVEIFGRAVRRFEDAPLGQDRDGMVEEWRLLAARAVSAAIGDPWSRPGPVHLNLPFTEPTVPETNDGRTVGVPFTQPLDGRPDGAPWLAVRPPGRRVDPRDSRLLQQAGGIERGLLVIGEGLPVDPAVVAEAATATGWPVVADPLSGCRALPSTVEGAPLVLATPWVGAHTPDVMIRIGRAVLSRELDALTAVVPRQLLIEPWGRNLDPTGTVTDVIAAPPDDALRSLGVVERGAGEWFRAWRDAGAVADGVVTRVLGESLHVPAEPAVTRTLCDSLPGRGHLVVGSSLPIRDVDRYGRIRAGITVHGNRGASGIDGFVSTAVGVACVADGPTVAYTGDLSFLHDQNGLLVDLDGGWPNLTLVVVDNDGGGLFHHLPQVRQPGFERLFATPHGLDLGDIARSHRLAYARVDALTGLASAIADAISRGGVSMIHVPTDRAGSVALRQRLAEQLVAALS